MSEQTGSLFPWEDDAGGKHGGAASPPPAPAAEPADAAQRVEAGVAPESTAEDAAAALPEPGSRRAERPLVRKEYYSISEVAELVGLPAHVLRYWESQFSVLNPSKNRSGNRVYQRKAIRLILLVKQLLYEEKYTVEGAKQKLEQLRRGGGLADATSRALDAQLVQALREELRAVSDILAPDAD